jgi:hypothetical protein
MRNEEFIESLSGRLVGRTIDYVRASNEDEAVCSLGLDDGSSIVLFATDLGAWFHDGPRSDGTYSSIGGLARAVEACRHKHGFDIVDDPPRARASASDDLITVEVVEGESFSVRLSRVSDPWERKVLSHPDVLSFIGRVVETSMWKIWFGEKNGYSLWIDGNPDVIPAELKLRDPEVLL